MSPLVPLSPRSPCPLTITAVGIALSALVVAWPCRAVAAGAGCPMLVIN